MGYIDYVLLCSHLISYSVRFRPVLKDQTFEWIFRLPSHPFSSILSCICLSYCMPHHDQHILDRKGILSWSDIIQESYSDCFSCHICMFHPYHTHKSKLIIVMYWRDQGEHKMLLKIFNRMFITFFPFKKQGQAVHKISTYNNPTRNKYASRLTGRQTHSLAEIPKHIQTDIQTKRHKGIECDVRYDSLLCQLCYWVRADL